MWSLGFPILSYFGSGFSTIGAALDTPKLLRGMRDKLNVTVGDHACRMTPETFTSQTMGPFLVSPENFSDPKSNS